MLTTADAHDRDINVINWNRNEPFIASGGDDGVLKIWDLRQFEVLVYTISYFLTKFMLGDVEFFD